MVNCSHHAVHWIPQNLFILWHNWKFLDTFPEATSESFKKGRCPLNPSSSSAGWTGCYCFLWFCFVFLSWVNGDSGMRVTLRIKELGWMSLNWSVSRSKPSTSESCLLLGTAVRKQMKYHCFPLFEASHHNLAHTHTHENIEWKWNIHETI